MTRFARLATRAFGLTALLLACSVRDGDEGSSVAAEADLRALDPSEIVGTLVPGQPSGPIAYRNPPLYRALSFEAAAKQTVDIDVESADGDAVAWLVEAATNKALAFNDDASKTTRDAHIRATVEKAGKYFVVFRERDHEPATFVVTLKAPASPQPGEACDRIDEIHQRRCGACGTQSTICTVHGGHSRPVWSAYSECTGEIAGGCVPGTTMTESCGLCGTRTKTCTQFCAWNVASCEGQVPNGCVPGTSELTTAGCPPSTYRTRACSTSCQFSPFGPCEPAPSTLEVPSAVGGVASTVVTLRADAVLPKLSGRCPAFLSMISTPYAYVQVKNPLTSAAKVTVFNSRAPDGVVLGTNLAAYASPTPPADEDARRSCENGVALGSNPSLTGDASFASLDGWRALTIPAGATYTIYVGADKAYDALRPSESTGTVLLNVKTEAIMP